jgi:hypothetical protein
MWRNGVAAVEDFIVNVGEGLSTAGDGEEEGLSTAGDGEGLSTAGDGDGEDLSTAGDGEGLYTAGDGEGLIIANQDTGLASITKERRRTRAKTPGGGGASDCRLRF